VQERTVAGGRAVEGLRDTLEALEAGKVDHLLLAAAPDSRGARDAVLEAMVRRGFETGAQLTLLGDEAAAKVAPAALLRW
jgi:hypothetical protein